MRFASPIPQDWAAWREETEHYANMNALEGVTMLLVQVNRVANVMVVLALIAADVIALSLCVCGGLLAYAYLRFHIMAAAYVAGGSVIFAAVTIAVKGRIREL